MKSYAFLFISTLLAAPSAGAVPAPAISGDELQDQEMMADLEESAVPPSEETVPEERHESTADLLSQDARARYREPPVSEQPSTPPAAVSRSERDLSASPMADVQRALRQQGEQVTVNGVYDARTRSALEEVQRRSGLDPTGKADPETLAALGIAPFARTTSPR